MHRIFSDPKTCTQKRAGREEGATLRANRSGKIVYEQSCTYVYTHVVPYVDTRARAGACLCVPICMRVPRSESL